MTDFYSLVLDKKLFEAGAISIPGLTEAEAEAIRVEQRAYYQAGRAMLAIKDPQADLNPVSVTDMQEIETILAQQEARIEGIARQVNSLEIALATIGLIQKLASTAAKQSETLAIDLEMIKANPDLWPDGTDIALQKILDQLRYLIDRAIATWVVDDANKMLWFSRRLTGLHNYLGLSIIPTMQAPTDLPFNPDDWSVFGLPIKD